MARPSAEAASTFLWDGFGRGGVWTTGSACHGEPVDVRRNKADLLAGLRGVSWWRSAVLRFRLTLRGRSGLLLDAVEACGISGREAGIGEAGFSAGGGDSGLQSDPDAEGG